MKKLLLITIFSFLIIGCVEEDEIDCDTLYELEYDKYVKFLEKNPYSSFQVKKYNYQKYTDKLEKSGCAVFPFFTKI